MIILHQVFCDHCSTIEGESELSRNWCRIIYQPHHILYIHHTSCTFTLWVLHQVTQKDIHFRIIKWKIEIQLLYNIRKGCPGFVRIELYLFHKVLVQLIHTKNAVVPLLPVLCTISTASPKALKYKYLWQLIQYWWSTILWGSCIQVLGTCHLSNVYTYYWYNANTIDGIW